MEQQKSLYLKINKKILILNLLFAAAFTIFSGGRLFALIIYSLILVVCATKYRAAFNFKVEESETAKSERKKLFSLYFVPILIHTCVLILIFVLGTLIKNKSGLNIPFLTKGFSGSESVYSFCGSFFLGLLFAAFILKFICGLIFKTDDIKTAALILSTIYIPVLYEAFYLVFLTLSNISKDIENIHIIFFYTCAFIFAAGTLFIASSILKQRKIYIGNEDVPKKRHLFLK